MFSPRTLTCPGCRRELHHADIHRFSFECPYCGVPIRISRRYFLVALVPAFLGSLLISQLLGLKAYAAPLWIPILLLCYRLVGPLPLPWLSLLKVDASSSRKGGGVFDRNLVLFLTVWFGVIFTILFYGFVLSWAAFLLGGSHADILESLDMWSMPLGWINAAFVIRPHTGFVAAVGIVTANSYYYALGITLVFKFVHQRLTRNRVTQLGISDSTLMDEDEV